MDVKAVSAGAPDDGAVVAGRLAIRAAAVEGDPTDAAGVVVGDPTPEKGPRHWLEISSTGWMRSTIMPVCLYWHCPLFLRSAMAVDKSRGNIKNEKFLMEKP